MHVTVGRVWCWAHKTTYRLRGVVYAQLLRSEGASIGRRLRVEGGLIFRQPFHGGYAFGDDVFVGSRTIFDITPGAGFVVGSGCVFTTGLFVSAIRGVTIGNRVLIGEYSSIRDANHRMCLPDVSIKDQGMDGSPIHIGDDVWVGRGAAVLAGAEIGDGAVIGANSVVIGKIPSGAIAVGAPARVIKMRFPTCTVARL